MDRNSAKGLILLLFLVFINIVNARVIRSGPGDSLDFETNGVNSRMEILSSGEVEAKTRFKMLDSMVFTPLTTVNRDGLATEDGLAIWNTDENELNIYDSTGTVWRQIVDLDSAQELTLKTINSDNNNIFNLVDLDIKVGAAITRSKLADGAANYVLINNGTGVISEEQYLDKTRGGTGITSTATFPASGTISTLAGTETFTNKTINGGTLDGLTASAVNQWTPPEDTTANLTTLCTSLDAGSFLYSTDENKYYLCDGTVLTEIGSGGASDPVTSFTASELYAALSTPAAATNVNLADVVLDTDSKWDSVNDEYNIPVSGDYQITAGATFTNMRYAYFYYVSLYKNGTEINQYWRVNNRFIPAAIAGSQAAGFNGIPTGIVSLLAGDKISVRVTGKSIDVSETGTIRHLLSINKLSSPTSSGGEIIGAKASMNHTQTLPLSVLTKIEFDTEENDTHGNYDPTTNYRYTVGAGQAGYYDINYNISLVAGVGVAWANCQVLINGSGTEITSTERADPISTQWYPYVGHATENLAVGDYVEMWCRSQAGTSDTLNTGSIGATFSVYKK